MDQSEGRGGGGDWRMFLLTEEEFSLFFHMALESRNVQDYRIRGEERRLEFLPGILGRLRRIRADLSGGESAEGGSGSDPDVRLVEKTSDGILLAVREPVLEPLVADLASVLTRLGEDEFRTRTGFLAESVDALVAALRTAE